MLLSVMLKPIPSILLASMVSPAMIILVMTMIGHVTLSHARHKDRSGDYSHVELWVIQLELKSTA